MRLSSLSKQSLHSRHKPSSSKHQRTSQRTRGHHRSTSIARRSTTLRVCRRGFRRRRRAGLANRALRSGHGALRRSRRCSARRRRPGSACIAGSANNRTATDHDLSRTGALEHARLSALRSQGLGRAGRARARAANVDVVVGVAFAAGQIADVVAGADDAAVTAVTVVVVAT